MKIDSSTDTITFDDADVAQLSPSQQKALTYYVGNNLDEKGNPVVSPANFLSGHVNLALTQAADSFSTFRVGQLKSLGEAIVSAPDDVKAKVQPLIDQVAVLLGLGKAPIPQVVTPPNI